MDRKIWIALTSTKSLILGNNTSPYMSKARTASKASILAALAKTKALLIRNLEVKPWKPSGDVHGLQMKSCCNGQWFRNLL
ncbi:hypothetical protein QL285_095085 [Trifolium repens]|nr:hypothetical protein QL285_095085 [Trifolium repens]